MNIKKNKILIADDHPLFLEGVKNVLENEESNMIIGISRNGNEALKKILELKPDVAILDFQMPDLTGLEVLQELKKNKSNTKCIILTMYRDKKIFKKSIDAGTLGYILKDEAVESITEAVCVVANGGTFISQSMSSILLDEAKEQNIIRAAEIHSLLTPTESKIVNLLYDFKSNEEISKILFISKRTVENHKTNIANKFNLQSSKHLTKYLQDNKKA